MRVASVGICIMLPGVWIGVSPGGCRSKYKRKEVTLERSATPIQQVAKLGRNANNGTNAGYFYWNLNNTSRNLNQNISRQLVFILSVY
jgi:hypothetical protein